MSTKLTLPAEGTAISTNPDRSAFEVISNASGGIMGQSNGLPHAPGLGYGVLGRLIGSGFGTTGSVINPDSVLAAAVAGATNVDEASGVWGVNNAGNGVMGLSGSGNGVRGLSTSGTGVQGFSTSGIGVAGVSEDADAVNGTSRSAAHAGVSGTNLAGGFGVWAMTNSSDGKTASPNAAGFFTSDTAMAVQAISNSQIYDAVNVKSSAPSSAAVSATNTAPFSGSNKVPSGYGVWTHSNNTAIYAQGNPAGFFNGNVQITETLFVAVDIVLTGADLAEDFFISANEGIEAGTVMVLGDNETVRPSDKSYDKKVVGVISGANQYRPGLVLDRQSGSPGRFPIALSGKVYCKIDATYGPIEVGDLLTTSPTAGHAMKADDPQRAFGSIIGKALRPLQTGQSLIPILIALL